MGELISLTDFTDDARSWSPEQLLEEALDFVKHEDNKHFKKAVLVMLNDSNDEYQITYFQAGMKRMEIVALLEDAKFEFLSAG